MAKSVAPEGTTVTCAHQGKAKPGTTHQRVKVGGKAVVLLPTPYTISGCSLPSNAGGPCATASWTTGSQRVTSMNQPLVVQGGQATCAPTGVPLSISTVQSRVTVS
jgi:uncharacterized Zn-binding protein involved in type VI secretion